MEQPVFGKCAGRAFPNEINQPSQQREQKQSRRNALFRHMLKIFVMRHLSAFQIARHCSFDRQRIALRYMKVLS